ncbi:MAG: hypothetical protein C5B51_27925, partial [Terriglobia bacterium]
MAVDPAGNVYFIAENCVFKVDAGGTLTRVAGQSKVTGYSGDGGPAVNAQLSVPGGIALDSAGNLYIADTFNNAVRKVTPSGTITTVAGNGTYGDSGDGGPGVNAQLSNPQAIAADANGNLYIADAAVIRKISASGTITTVAGTGTPGYSGDGGPALNAQIGPCYGLALDLSGNLYLADYSNSVIRKVTTGGTITTTAGNGTPGFSGDGGPALNAQLRSPGGIATDLSGNLYIADSANSRIRKVATNGTISTVAGNGIFPGSGPGFIGPAGDGSPATSAQLGYPTGVAVDSAGSLYIADPGSDRVRKVVAGIMFSEAGNGFTGYSGDGGPASGAQMGLPLGMAVDTLGNFYVSDSDNNVVRKIAPGGPISTIAGDGKGTPGYSGDGGPATSAALSGPAGLAIDAAGNLFIADLGNNAIRKVAANGTISTVAGNSICGYLGDGGPASAAELCAPWGLALDTSGNLYIADSGNNVVRKIAGGTITTIAGNGTAGFSGDGSAATGAQLFNPTGVAVDGAGRVYIADAGNSRIRAVSNGTITTVAGGGGVFPGDGGPATSAQLGNPSGVSVDAAGNFYIADSSSGLVRRVATNGIITTVAGTPALSPLFYSGDGGPALNAAIGSPQAAVPDAAGRIYIADGQHNLIRALTSSALPSVISASPASGIGSSQSFAITVSDNSGPGFISVAYLLVNTSLSTASGCMVEFNRSANTFRLFNDAGSAWLGPITLGAVASLSNSQCTVAAANATTAISANNLTVVVPLTFSNAFSGTKSTYVSVTDNASQSSGWQTTGTWTVLGPPAVISVSPSAGTGTFQTFAITAGDGGGAAAISAISFLVNGGLSGASACWVLFSPGANTLQLANDAGNAFSAPVTLGTSAALSNSQCTVSALTASAAPNGFNVLTLNLPLSFTYAFAGVKATFTYTADSTQNSGWQSTGSWTVPGSGSPAIIALLPASGAGSSQTFSITVADGAGATAIASVAFLVNSGINGANACWVAYNRGSNTLQLANDAGSGFSAPVTVGSASTLSNRQCTVNAATASAAATGANLTVNLPLSFSGAFSGNRGTFIVAADTLGQSTGWQAGGTWTVPAGPTLAGTVPASGSGSAQTFAITVSDPGGPAAITNILFLVNNGLSGVNGCWISFAPAANTLQLVNDAGTGFSAPVALGTASPLFNSQCTINVAAAAVSLSGNSLTLYLPISFSFGFGGAKVTFTSAADSSQNTGWQTAGSWTVPSAGPPAVVSTTPAAGSGAARNFAVTVADGAGPAAINNVSFLINSGLTGVNGCWVLFNRAANTLQLANNAASGFSAPITIGTSASLSNSQCALSGSSASVTAAGNNLTLIVPLSFAFAFAGVKNTYVVSADNSSQSSGWVNTGFWTVPSSGPPAVIATTPAAGSGSFQIFTVTAADGGGSSLISSVSFLVNNGLTGSNGCWVLYNRAANTLQLANDPATGFSAPVTIGTAAFLSNSQCTLNAASASTAAAGTALTFSIPLSFTFAFGGVKNLFAMAVDNNSLNSGWANTGSWTVPSSGLPMVTSSLPASGSGASQTFAITVSDGGGAAAINNVSLLINTGISGAAACWVLYNRAANTLQLANDSATGFSAPVTVGAASSLSNSQCTLSAASASVSAIGAALTVNIPLNFAFGFAGPKNLYVLAVDNAAQNSGWTNSGTWTVPSSGPPVVFSTVPNAGSGSAQTFSVTVADGGGASAINNVSLLINTGINGAAACWVLYSRAANTLQLANDAASGFSAPVTLGAASSLSNSQCTLSAASASATTAGTTLTINIPVSFNFAFNGVKNLYVLAVDNAAQNSGWVQAGSWTVAVSGPPVVISSTPASGIGSAQLFGVTVADVSGPAAINTVSLLINVGISGANGCWVLFNRAANTLQLANDAATGFSAPVTIGTAASLANSQCTLNVAAASIGTAGNNLTFSLPLSFSFAFAGLKNLFVLATDNASQNSGWAQTGSWTVPASGPPAVVATTPASGSGASQIFA